MRAVIQRVSAAHVKIGNSIVGEIGPGLLVLLGVAPADTDADASWLAEKICALRIFEDDTGKMNRSLLDLAATDDSPPSPVPCPPSSAPCHPSSDLRSPSPVPWLPSSVPCPPSSALRPLLLVVSQFTLFASTRKGTRPSFNDAAKPDHAIPLYESFLRHATAALGRQVASGQFGAMMEVSLVNDGPVTLIIDSKTRE